MKQERDQFLADPDNIHYRIHCLECKIPLWETKVLKRSGARVISTESTPCAPNEMKFSTMIQKCPLCEEKFFHQGKNGNQSYLIHDLNSGIRRLV